VFTVGLKNRARGSAGARARARSGTGTGTGTGTESETKTGAAGAGTGAGASKPCGSSRIKASVAVLVGVVLGGCPAVWMGMVVLVVAAVGGSLLFAVVGSVLMAVLAADSYPVGGSRLTPPEENEQIIMIG
jgi:hypothetical protein